jgi:predicted HAD superfamily Cof-like phosphohydrolase
MSNVFHDQSKFMSASNQTVGTLNDEQLKLYLNLITEEYDELRVAVANKDRIETLDALLDLIVVTVGAIHSLGVDSEGAWKEVMGSNLAKIDRTTGKVEKRSDGKVMKPDNWYAPKLEQYFQKSE